MTTLSKREVTVENTLKAQRMGPEQFEIVDIGFDGSEALVTDDFYSPLDVTKAVAMTQYLAPQVEKRVARYKNEPDKWICEVSPRR